jgi:glyoxylase-like metal-dependent hydrolase (beta-lactamase superfamily II)
MQCEVIEVTRYKLNCSLVWCEETGAAAVIDPGGDHDTIFNMIELLEIKPEVVLITHGHFDHAGQAARFAEASGARIEGPHRGDAHLIARLPEFGAKYETPSRAYEPARWLDQGDTVIFGKAQMQVIHCPGHCHGHVAYFSPDLRQAFVGDILFRGAIGAWEHADGDLPLLLSNIRNRLFTLGDDIEFVPGHGPCSTFGRERQENPFVGDAAWAKWQERMT